MKRSQSTSEGSTTASTKSSNNNNNKYRPTFSTIGKLQTPEIYKHNAEQNQYGATKLTDMESILEMEKTQNKLESWNKLDRTIKRQKLHAFAESYGIRESFSVRDVKKLKTFFSDCLDKGKLSKTKDVVYNKDKQEIDDIPSLLYNSTSGNFTIRNNDAKYISTLKSMTPKRSVSLGSAIDELVASTVSPPVPEPFMEIGVL